MKKVQRITVGSLVGLVLMAAVAGTASAAPASTATTGITVGTSKASTPPTSSPFTSTPASPSTSAPTTTSPTTSSPATTAPSAKPKKSKKARKKKDVMTGAEIWRIVSGHHSVSCAHATKEMKRVRAADAAITQRLGRWSTRSAAAQKSTAQKSTAQKSTAKKAKAMATRTGKKVKFFRNLEKKATALTKRIEAQCPAKAATN